MFWTTLQQNAKNGGIGLALIAVGALGQSTIDKSTKLPWLHQQASELRATRTVLIPKLKADAKCEHVRADKAVDVAAEAITSTVVPQTPAPAWEDLPSDCPHTASAK